MSASFRFVVCAAVAIAVPGSAFAQSRSSHWEVEGYGGVSAAHATAKAPSLPAPGPSLDTLSPTFPTRAVPSWFFGDGATLFNSVQSDFGVASPIATLDPVLTARTASHGAAFGARIRRTLSARFALEGGVDVFAGGGDAASRLRNAADGASASFKSGFTALLETGPFTGLTVTSTASTSDHARHDVAVTGALVWSLRSRGTWTPYVTAGGGAWLGAGDFATATLDGRYQFAILGVVPIDERDHVVVHYDTRTTPVAVAGGGFRHDFNTRWAMRADARAFIGADPTHVTIDAAPSVQTATPANFTQTFTSPSIQFSNNPSTGRQPSLSAAALNAFVTGKNGVGVRVLVSVTLVRRL
jgi:hypothetical protein